MSYRIDPSFVKKKVEELFAKHRLKKSKLAGILGKRGRQVYQDFMKKKNIEGYEIDKLCQHFNVSEEFFLTNSNNIREDENHYTKIKSTMDNEKATEARLLEDHVKTLKRYISTLEDSSIIKAKNETIKAQALLIKVLRPDLEKEMEDIDEKLSKYDKENPAIEKSIKKEKQRKSDQL